MKFHHLALAGTCLVVATAQHDHGSDSEECEEALESFVEFLEANERRRFLNGDHEEHEEHHLELRLVMI